MAGPGLYANIHAKRKRGGKMRKKGAKGAPTAANFARAAQTARKGMKKGGFPDLSGDGKTTMKDILIGRGVIKKGDKKMQKKTAMKRGGMTKKKRVKAMGGGAMKKRMKRGGRAMKRGGGMMKPEMMGGGIMKKRMKRGGSVSQMAQRASRMNAKKLQGSLKEYKKLIKKKMKRGGKAK